MTNEIDVLKLNMLIKTQDEYCVFLFLERRLMMNNDLKKILVEVTCTVVRNVLVIWKREVLKKKK